MARSRPAVLGPAVPSPVLTTPVPSPVRREPVPSWSPAQAARAALGTSYHLAVVAGPCAGLVLPVEDGSVIGRSEVLTDPTLSRYQVLVRVRGDRVLVAEAGSRNGTSLLRRRRPPRGLGAAPRRMHPGDRLRAGTTLLELRSRPRDLRPGVPGPPRASRGARVLPWLSLLVLATLGTVGALTGTRGVLGSLMVAPVLLMAGSRLLPVRGAHRPTRTGREHPGWTGSRGRVPDPASMLLVLAAAAHQRGTGGHGHGSAGQARGTREEPVRAWAGPRRRRWLVTLAPGDALALQGPGAPDALTWWLAQVAAAGDVDLQEDGAGITLLWPDGGGTARLVAVGPDDRTAADALGVLPLTDPGLGLTAAWTMAVRELAVLAPGACGTGATTGPPDTIPLESVTGEIDRERVSRAWAETRDVLPAVLGIGAAGAARADLVAHGPHALVVGTTGAGKSELLTSWLLQLCLARPPERLALVLVDYKGGAAFDPLRRLPHTAGVLTDLDPAGTWRALSSLRAEVARRERLLAERAAKDVAALPPTDRPARLVIVVDEFAALTAEHPDVLDALVRVAAQGRSLGLHLVLATQRPQGAVTPAIRANTALRVCLRVLEPGESRDVLGHDGAASLDRLPGRLMVSGADEAPAREALQAPWVGDARDLARAVRELVAAAQGRPRPFRPWAAPLPSRARRSPPRRVTAAAGAAPPAGRGPVLLALTDLPDEQRLGRWSWDPLGALLVLGSARSGRTTALDSLARGACARGRAAQLCGPDWERRGAGRWTPGTVVGPQDPRRLARLWRLALDGALAGDLLVLDDVESLVVAVDEQLGPGQGQGMLEALVRTLPALGTGLVVSATLGAATSRWTSGMATRLVLGASQPAQASVAGLPRGVVTGREAGRGVVLEQGAATACQVLLPDTEERWGPGTPCGRGPTRVEPLPTSVPPRTGAWALGGDEAGPVPLPPGSVLVVGPPGSGRSTALRALVHAHQTRGSQPQGPSAPPGQDAPRAPGAGLGPLVIDDLDLADPGTQARVEEELGAGRTVLASATTERCASAYRGVLAVLRERADLLVLRPGSGPASQVAGTGLRPVVDVRAPTHPGRGALIHQGTVVPVQVVLRRPRTAGLAQAGTEVTTSSRRAEKD